MQKNTYICFAKRTCKEVLWGVANQDFWTEPIVPHVLNFKHQGHRAFDSWTEPTIRELISIHSTHISSFFLVYNFLWSALLLTGFFARFDNLG